MLQENRDRNNQQLESKETKIYLTPDSTLQTPEEDHHDRSINPGKDNAISVSNDQVQKFIEWCRIGPRRAIVHHVDIMHKEEESFSAFHVIRQ